VSIDQQRVLNVARDNCQLVNIDVVDVIDDVNTTALRRVSRLDNPHIALWLSLAKFLVVGMEIMEFIW